MSPTNDGSETLTLDANYGKVMKNTYHLHFKSASRSIWVSRSTRVSLDMAKHAVAGSLYGNRTLNTPVTRLNVAKGTIQKIGKFCSRLDAIWGLQKHPKGQVMWFMQLSISKSSNARGSDISVFLWYFCDISVYFCKTAPETNSLPHLSWTVWNRTASASCKDRSA